MLYLIAPVFNEGHRLRDFITAVLQTESAKNGLLRLILVDDGSIDEGAAVMSQFEAESRVVVLRHLSNQGVARAFTTGIRHALSQCSDEDAIGVIESDGSNDLAILPELLDRVADDSDVAIASRNIPGGDYFGFPARRRMLSRTGNALFRIFLPVSGVTDFTMFYRVYRAGALRPIFAGSETTPFLFPGFSANAEILFKLAETGARFSEVPHEYRYDRKVSGSKIRVVENTLQSLRLIAHYRVRRMWVDPKRWRERLPSWPTALIVGLLIMIQLGWAGLEFENPSDILRDTPILSFDHFAHYLISSYLAPVYRQTGELWVFLPDWLAGLHITGFLEAQGPVVFLGILSGFRHMGFWLQFLYFFLIGLMPFALYRGFRLFGVGVQGTLVATFLGFLYLIGSFPSFLGLVGDMASFAALYGSLYFIALFRRFLDTRGQKGFWALLTLLPLYVLTHKSTIIILAPIAALTLAVYRRNLNRRSILGGAAIAGLIFAVNAFWILGIPKFARYMTTDISPFYKDQGLRQLFYDFFTITAYFPPWEHHGMVGLLIMHYAFLTAGIWGLWTIRRMGDRRLFAVMLGSIIYYAFMSYASDVVPVLRELKPLRLVAPLNLLFVAAAAIALEHNHAFMTFERRYRRRNRRLVIALCLIGAMCFFVGSMFRARIFVEPLQTRFPQNIVELREWIETQTDSSGRILFEQWKELPEEFKEPEHHLHAGAFLPTGSHLYANGFHPVVYSLFAYPDFVAGELMRQPVATMSDAQLSDYFRAYNVRWVIAWSGESRRRFLKVPYLRLTKTIYGFQCFIVERKPDYFLIGSGEVETGTDFIRAKNVSPVDGRAVLSFHYFPYLEAGSVKIGRTSDSPIPSVNDPMGFIEVFNPPREFEIRKKAHWSP